MHLLILKRTKTLVRDFFSVLSFTFLMILASNIKVPLFFSPVPITLQTFVLFLSFAFLKNKASLPQAIYILLGIAGVPVFSKGGSGLLYLAGPTGGYIIGFFISALIFPHFLDKCWRQKKTPFLFSFVIFALTIVLVYSLGITWLVFLHGFSLGKAFLIGAVPFIWGDLAKIILASLITVKILKRW